MVDMDIDFSKSDVRDFGNVIQRLQRELGWSPARAGTYAFIGVLKSLRASTKRSKKVRKIRVASRKRKGRTNRRFKVEHFRGGAKSSFYVYAGSLAEAKQSKSAKIKYRGLAKASWGRAMRDVFNRGGPGRVGFRMPSDIVSGFSRSGKGSFSAQIENRVDYIRNAFVTSGDRAVTTSMARANRSMIRKIEKDLIKAAKK